MVYVKSFRDLEVYKLAREVSEECGYLNSEIAMSLMQKCESIGKMIQSMIDKSSTFCKK